MADTVTLKKAVELPVIVNGGFQERSLIENALAQGCDLVSIGRPLLANIDLFDILQHQEKPDNPCTFCNRCDVRTSLFPLGCYDVSRFGGDYERMEQQIIRMSGNPIWPHPNPPACIPGTCIWLSTSLRSLGSSGAGCPTTAYRYQLIYRLEEPTATIQKPKAVTVTGGRCQLKEDGTLGVKIGPNPAMPTVAFTVGPGAFMADQMHANKAKFTGPGKYTNEIISLYLGKTALQDSYMGLGTVTVAADKKSGTFAPNDGKAAGSFDCGAAPAKP